jgi:hypothetical protein
LAFASIAQAIWAATIAPSFLSLRFMRLPHRFPAWTPFSSFVSIFFSAYAFVSRPPVGGGGTL